MIYMVLKEREKETKGTSGRCEEEWWLTDLHAVNSHDSLCVQCLTRASHAFLFTAIWASMGLLPRPTSTKGSNKWKNYFY